MKSMVKRVLEQAQRGRVFSHHERVVVAVSGGADSMVLLEVLLALQQSFDLFLHVAHLDHGLRSGSGADARFVATYARAKKLPYTLGQVDVRRLAKQRKRSLETAARRERYDFLQRVAREQRCDKIALGHHKNDQVETFFLNLVRGAGVQGLKGMLAQNGPYVRPLLDCHQSEILAYAREHHLPFRPDPSNEDVGFRRNWVRRRLIPTLERALNPNLIETLWRSQNHFCQVADFMRAQTQRAFLDVVVEQHDDLIALDRSKFVALHPALQAELVRLVVERLAGDLKRLTAQHVESVLDHAHQASSGQTLLLPRLWCVIVRAQTLCFQRRVTAIRHVPADEKQLDPNGQETRWEGWTFVATLCPATHTVASPPKNVARLSAVLDWGTIAPPLVVRSRQPGDRIDPLGLGGHKKIQDLFVDAKLSRAVRDTIPIVQDQRGIVWVVGYAQSERTKLSAHTRRILNVVVKKDTQNKD